MAVPIALIVAAAQAGYGAYKSSQAKKEAAKLAASRPVLEDSGLVQSNVALAESELARGSSGGAEEFYNRGVDRNMSSSIDNLLKGGGSVNNIAEIFDRSLEGRQRALLFADNVRQQRIQQVINTRQTAEARGQQQFQFNKWAPWADRSQANAAARQGASEMTWSGIDSAGAAAENYFNAPGQEPDTDAWGNSGGSDYNFTPTTVNRNSTTFNSPGANVNYINPNAAPAFQPNYPSPFDDLEYDS